MKLFENETNYQTKDTDFSYMLQGSKREYCSVVLPKIEHSMDKRIMQVINLDLSREKKNKSNGKLLMDVMNKYQNLMESTVFERRIVAGINLLSILFSLRHNNEIYETYYGTALNKMLMSGHFSGLYFEAIDLMDSELEENQCRGRNLMIELNKNGNPLARKRKEIIHQLGYIDFNEI